MEANSVHDAFAICSMYIPYCREILNQRKTSAGELKALTEDDSDSEKNIDPQTKKGSNLHKVKWSRTE